MIALSIDLIMIVEFRVTIFQTASSIAENIAKVWQYFLLVLLTALTTTPWICYYSARQWVLYHLVLAFQYRQLNVRGKGLL